ncbi:hypothetical protein LEMLEM_LOCUS9783 [Lemmus lemmus]
MQANLIESGAGNLSWLRVFNPSTREHGWITLSSKPSQSTWCPRFHLGKTMFSSTHVLTGNVEEKEEDTGNENLRVNSTTRWA